SPDSALSVHCHERPDLHSFPTRRSSDLLGDAVFDVGHGSFPMRRYNKTAVGERWRGRKFSGMWFRERRCMGVAFRDPARFRVIADRKSTRLNSSHVKISYAVFCLKKKKT